MKSFVIIDSNVIALCIDAIRAIEIISDAPFQVVIRKYKEKRTSQQNQTYWGRLQDISEQLILDGRRYDAETWHEQMKRDFLPEMCEKGVEKWKYLPEGSRVLNMSTTDLNTKEFYDYRLQVEADGAGMGVMFTTRDRDFNQ